MPRRLFFAPTGPAAVTIVGSAKATTPPTETTPNAGNTVVIPVPSGVVDGDILLAAVQDTQFASSGTLPPSGWAFINGTGAGGFALAFVRTASSEPASHTWTFNQSDRPRSGCMIAIRNASIGDFALASGTFNLASLTAVSNGAMLLALGWTDSDALSEDWLDNSPIAVEIQHCADGDDASGNLANSVIYTEAGLSAGVISGRVADHVGDNSGFREIVGVIMEPA